MIKPELLEYYTQNTQVLRPKYSNTTPKLPELHHTTEIQTQSLRKSRVFRNGLELEINERLNFAALHLNHDINHSNYKQGRNHYSTLFNSENYLFFP